MQFLRESSLHLSFCKLQEWWMKLLFLEIMFGKYQTEYVYSTVKERPAYTGEVEISRCSTPCVRIRSPVVMQHTLFTYFPQWWYLFVFAFPFLILLVLTSVSSVLREIHMHLFSRLLSILNSWSWAFSSKLSYPARLWWYESSPLSRLHPSKVDVKWL